MNTDADKWFAGIFLITDTDFDFSGINSLMISVTMVLHLHLLPGENGAQTRRVSVPIGNHQPIGVAQTKRVGVPIGGQLIETAQMKRARLRHGSHRCHGSEE